MRKLRAAAMAAALAMGLVASTAGAARILGMDDVDAGKADFSDYCASCHGSDARGGGPVAPFLVRHPPDLTTLEARNGGVFPTDHVFFIIDGRADVGAHGPREMPVWGYGFGPDQGTEADKKDARRRILNIIAYLKTLQRADPGEESDGSE
jgi:mono/diheme cytochrome c family protein